MKASYSVVRAYVLAYLEVIAKTIKVPEYEFDTMIEDSDRFVVLGNAEGVSAEFVEGEWQHETFLDMYDSMSEDLLEEFGDVEVEFTYYGQDGHIEIHVTGFGDNAPEGEDEDDSDDEELDDEEALLRVPTDKYQPPNVHQLMEWANENQVSVVKDESTDDWVAGTFEEEDAVGKTFESALRNAHKVHWKRLKRKGWPK